MSSLAGLLRRNWFPISAGLLCFGWAFIAWLTVIPNQDLLADGIQVQSLIHDPRVVLSFPGQKHGGVIEYPYNALAEWIAPGNYFLESALRPIFAFLTGFLAARLYLTYFTKAPRWSFLLAVAVGPTVLHGLAGPEGNPVGVWWLNANYDLAWLLVILGFWLLGREVSPAPIPATRSPRAWIFLVSGIAIGLGFYQQPTSIMLIIPMSVLFLLRFAIGLRQVAVLFVGGATGIIPSVLSYFFAPVTTWNPSHFPVFQPGLALASLGLDGIPNYGVALLPSALGFGPAATSVSGRLQSMATAGLLTLMIVCGIVGGLSAIRLKHRVTDGTAVAITWIAVAVGIVLFGIFVDPVWFYASHLALILWISVGLLPQIFRRHRAGIFLVWISVIAIAGCTLNQNFAWYRAMNDRIVAKQHYLESLAEFASLLEEQKTDYVYGSYLDVIPIGYGSRGSIHAISSTYDRFPLENSAFDGESRFRVAVRVDPADAWGTESLARVQNECETTGQPVEGRMGRFQVFLCPISLATGD